MVMPPRDARRTRFVRGGAKGIAWCICLLLLLLGEGTAAAAASTRLIYARSPEAIGCPDEDGLRHAIAARVGYDPVFPVAPNSIVVSITRVGDRLAADVTLVGPDGVIAGARPLRARTGDCDQLIAAVALTVAIALDTIERNAPAAEVETRPDPAEPLREPPAPVPVPALAQVSASSPRDRAPTTSPRGAGAAEERLHVETGAGVGAVIGVTPGIAIAPAVFASLRWRWLEVGLEGRDVVASSTGAPRIRASLLGGGPLVCLHGGPLFGCAISLLGSLHADAPDTPGTTSADAFYASVGLRAGGGVKIGLGISVRASLDVLANPLGPSVHASAGQLAWNAPPASGGARLDVVVRIP